MNSIPELSDEFFRIAGERYSDDAFWLGEDEAAVRRQFSTENDYFRTGRAWAETAEGCRLAGFFNPEQRINDEAVAYFGFWENSGDTDAVLNAQRDLFARFERWAAEQGAERIYGPINFNTYGPYRLRLADEQGGMPGPVFAGEPYNPLSYGEQLQALGYDIHYRYYTRINNNLPALALQMEKPLAQALQQLQGEFIVSRLDGDTWMNNLPELYPLIDRMFHQNFAYSPISEAQFVAACGEPFARKLCPQSSVLVRHKSGAIAGFFLCYPDYSPLQVAGSLMKAADISYAKHAALLPEPRLALAKTGAIHPDYRQAGLFTLMSMQLTCWAAPHYQRVAAALVREDNPSLRYAHNGEEVRVYGLFTKQLARAAVQEGSAAAQEG